MQTGEATEQSDNVNNHLCEHKTDHGLMWHCGM